MCIRDRKINGVCYNGSGQKLEGAVTRGIDVSEWQDTINWSQVKKSNVDFAFVRISYGLNHLDKTYDYNMKQAEKAGVPTGTYVSVSYTHLDVYKRQKIDSVSVDVSSKLEGIDQDTTITGAELTITDKNQDTLSSNSMSYLKFDNNGKVNVTAKLWKVRSDIRISAGYTGEPAEGYVVDSVTTVPETFSVAGSEEALNNLKLQGNTIYLDNENVDISGKSNDVEKKVNLRCV